MDFDIFSLSRRIQTLAALTLIRTIPCRRLKPAIGQESVI